MKQLEEKQQELRQEEGDNSEDLQEFGMPEFTGGIEMEEVKESELLGYV